MLFIRLARDFMAHSTSPEKATISLKKMAASIFTGCNVIVINPSEGLGERAFLSPDYNMPPEWVRKMVSAYGQIALIEPDPSTTGGINIFSNPFIWIYLDLGGEASSALLVVPFEQGSAPGSETLTIARELKLFLEHAADRGGIFEQGRTDMEKREWGQLSGDEKEDLVRNLDRAVREPLNAIIGYSMLLLDGSVAGPLSDPQAGFVQDILQGGYVVLKHIEEFREKVLPEE
jgi:signal transduction histidine kinase